MNNKQAFQSKANRPLAIRFMEYIVNKFGQIWGLGLGGPHEGREWGKGPGRLPCEYGGPPCKNYAVVSVKLSFIPALALLGMHSTYIGQLVRAAAAPLILYMHPYIGKYAYA